MGIRKLDWNDWIEMDSNFLRYHDLKASELKKDFASHVKCVDNPVVRDACFEVYEELNEYLIHRYPKVFQNDGKSLRNTLTGEQHPYPASSPEEALSCAALLVQDDLILMVEEESSYSQLSAFLMIRRAIQLMDQLIGWMASNEHEKDEKKKLPKKDRLKIEDWRVLTETREILRLSMTKQSTINLALRIELMNLSRRYISQWNLFLTRLLPLRSAILMSLARILISTIIIL
ncbi:hypothetical protein LTR41_011251 [Exophiala xenobiotica]|nr:hypothetical protein LTR41_011251 [Exophiala xenobiotica]KAK5550920.1 hypothetical protein LTR46_011063 [Exophiala xenobiotica]